MDREGGETMDTKAKTEAFFQTVCMPKVTFCQKVGISTSALYFWQKGTLNLSKKTLEKIENYLSKYDSIMQAEENK